MSSPFSNKLQATYVIQHIPRAQSSHYLHKSSHYPYVYSINDQEVFKSVFQYCKYTEHILIICRVVSNNSKIPEDTLAYQKSDFSAFSGANFATKHSIFCSVSVILVEFYNSSLICESSKQNLISKITTKAEYYDKFFRTSKASVLFIYILIEINFLRTNQILLKMYIVNRLSEILNLQETFNVTKQSVSSITTSI